MKLAIDSKRATTSLALIILICFFLPWVQLSCGTSENKLSGVDLARDSHKPYKRPVNSCKLGRAAAGSLVPLQ
jgi:hypothetical protein